MDNYIYGNNHNHKVQLRDMIVKLPNYYIINNHYFHRD